MRNNRNKMIVKISAIFTIIYIILPVVFFSLILEYDMLLYVFYIPSVVWYGITLFEGGIIAFLCYAIFALIFWVICFTIIKLGVSIYDEFNQSDTNNGL